MQKKAIIISLIVLASVACFAIWGFFTMMSNEVLESFGTMEERFEATNLSVDDELEKLKKQISEQEFKRLHRVALEVESSSNRLHQYIEDLKQDMLSEQNIESGVMDYSKMDKPSVLLFENNKERGQEFISEIELYKKRLLLKLEDFSYKTFVDSVNNTFVTNRLDGKDWLEYEFNDFPLIASYTKLTMIQSDIKDTQLLAYYLLEKE